MPEIRGIAMMIEMGETAMIGGVGIGIGRALIVICLVEVETEIVIVIVIMIGIVTGGGVIVAERGVEVGGLGGKVRS